MNINAGEKTTRHTNELRNERFTFIQRKTNKHNKSSTRKFIFFFWGGGGVGMYVWVCAIRSVRRSAEVCALLKRRLSGVPGQPEGQYLCESVTCTNTTDRDRIIQPPNHICVLLSDPRSTHSSALVWSCLLPDTSVAPYLFYSVIKAASSKLFGDLFWLKSGTVTTSTEFTSCYIILSSCPSEF